MVGIGGNATNTEENQRLKASDILIRIPQLAHIIVIVPAAGGSTLVALRNQLLLFCIHLVDNCKQRIIVKVYIGQSRKETFHDHGSGRIADHMLIAFGGTGQTDEAAGQLILDLGGIRFLSADTDLTCTGLAAGSLFTLKTKHSLSPLHDDLSVGTDGNDMKGNILAAVSHSGLYGMA